MIKGREKLSNIKCKSAHIEVFDPTRLNNVGKSDTHIYNRLKFQPPSWLGWIKLFNTMWNWSLSPMTFLINLPTVLSKTISQNDLGESYEDLLGLGIMIIVDFLKWDGQYSRSIHALVILMTHFKQLISWKMCLKWLYNNLSRPRVDELLQLAMVFLNFSLEKRAHGEGKKEVILSRTLISMLQWRAVLKNKCRAYQSSSMFKYSLLLYLIASIAGSLCLLT